MSPRHGAEGRALAWLPRGEGSMRYGAAGLLNALGTGVFYPYALLIFQDLSRLPLTTVGAGLTAATLAVLPAMSAVGRATDRLGPRAVLIAASLARSAAYLGYVLLPGLLPFLVLSMVVALGNRAEQVSSPTLAAALAPSGQTGRWLALSRAVFNAGVGGGALIASAFVAGGHRGFVILSVANAVSFLGTAALHRSLPRVAPHPRTVHDRRGRPWRDRTFLATALIATALWIVALAIEAAAPVVVIRHLALSPWVVGLLFAVNTALLAVLYLPVGRWLEGRITTRNLAVGTLLHCSLPVAFLALDAWRAAPTVVILLVGMAIYTAGELVATQVTMVILTRLPPDHERGSYLAFHQTMIGVASGVVPLLVTALLARSPAALWWTLVALAAAAASAAPLSTTAARPAMVQPPATRR